METLCSQNNITSEFKQPTAMTLVNQTGTGGIFTNYLCAVPLWDDRCISSSVSPVVAFLGVVQDPSLSTIKQQQEQYQVHGEAKQKRQIAIAMGDLLAFTNIEETL